MIWTRILTGRNEDTLTNSEETGSKRIDDTRSSVPAKVPTESNFASAVIYVDTIACSYPKNAVRLADEFASIFKSYEIIVVDDECASDAVELLIAELVRHPVSIVHMGHQQGQEAAMNAGVDASIGDYIFEIDDLGAFDVSFVQAAYEKAMKGADIVNGVYESGSSPRGRLFYSTFNRFSGFPTKLASNPCRLLSRRAVNRVRSMSEYAPYRKASYAASGLKVAEVKVAGRATHKTDLAMAVTSLALYTDVFYKVASWLSVLMAVLSLIEIIYVVAIAASGIAVAGWVTTMLVLSIGFMAVFVLFAFALKYLDLLVKITFVKQGYLTDGIERPDK